MVVTVQAIAGRSAGRLSSRHLAPLPHSGHCDRDTWWEIARRQLVLAPATGDLAGTIRKKNMKNQRCETLEQKQNDGFWIHPVLTDGFVSLRPDSGRENPARERNEVVRWLDVTPAT